MVSCGTCENNEVCRGLRPLEREQRCRLQRWANRPMEKIAGAPIKVYPCDDFDLRHTAIFTHEGI